MRQSFVDGQTDKNGEHEKREGRPKTALHLRRMALPGAGVVLLLAWPLTSWMGMPGPASKGISEEAARSLAAKIQTLSNPQPVAPARPMTITDMEANSYLTLHGHEFLPPAIRNPQVHISPSGVTTAADVDFDQLGRLGAQNDDWGARALAMIFSGKQRIEATGKLQTANGEGRLTVESFNVGTTSIPAGFANFLLQNYLEKKYQIDLSKPFPLPVRVSRIALGDGIATLYFNPAPGH